MIQSANIDHYVTLQVDFQLTVLIISIVFVASCNNSLIQDQVMQYFIIIRYFAFLMCLAQSSDNTSTNNDSAIKCCHHYHS